MEHEREKKAASVLRRLFSPPVFPGDEDATRQAAIIHAIILNLAVISTVAMVGTLTVFGNKRLALVFILVLLALAMTADALARRKRLRAASVFLVGGMWIIYSGVVLLSGSIRNPGLTYDLAVVVTAALLLGRGPALALAGASLGLGLSLALAEIKGIRLPAIFPGPPLGMWASSVIAFSLALMPLFLAVKNLGDALTRARTSENRYVALFSSAPMGYIIIRPRDGIPIIAECNQGFLELLGCGMDDVIGRPLAEFYTETSQAALATLYPRTLQVETPVPFERELVARDGRVVTVLAKTTPEIDAEGRHTGVLVMFLDYTERKRAEERLAASLAEKEALLRELYHRTKNNMSTINALLALQADFSGDPRLGESLAETQNRIRSMALVHQKLYEARNLSRIDLRDYLGDLVRLLTEGRDVAVSMEPAAGDEPILVPMEDAIPLGLVFNELMSNAIKHAFPDGRRGSISVSLGRAGQGEIELRVSDDGVGVPPDFDFRRDGKLGLLTVFGVGESQLKGTVAFERGDGLACTLRFSPGLYPGHAFETAR